MMKAIQFWSGRRRTARPAAPPIPAPAASAAPPAAAAPGPSSVELLAAECLAAQIVRGNRAAIELSDLFVAGGVRLPLFASWPASIPGEPVNVAFGVGYTDGLWDEPRSPFADATERDRAEYSAGYALGGRDRVVTLEVVPR